MKNLSMYMQNAILEYEPESIEAIATVYTDRQYQITLQVNPSDSRVGNPYFKLYDSASFRTASKVARISFLEPKYIIHTDASGKQPYVLRSKEKKLLLQILTKQMPGTSYSIWKALIIAYNAEKFDMNSQDSLDLTIAVKKQLPSNHEFIDALPIDLPIPDYTKL